MSAPHPNDRNRTDRPQITTTILQLITAVSALLESLFLFVTGYAVITLGLFFTYVLIQALQQLAPSVNSTFITNAIILTVCSGAVIGMIITGIWFITEIRHTILGNWISRNYTDR